MVPGLYILKQCAYWLLQHHMHNMRLWMHDFHHSQVGSFSGCPISQILQTKNPTVVWIQHSVSSFSRYASPVLAKRVLKKCVYTERNLVQLSLLLPINVALFAACVIVCSCLHHNVMLISPIGSCQEFPIRQFSIFLLKAATCPINFLLPYPIIVRILIFK